MLDPETESKVDELAGELYEAHVDDQTIRFWEGGIVRSAPTGAPPEYISVEIEGIHDENVDWRGVPPTPAVGDEVVVWENPISHRREIFGASGATGVTGGSSICQKITVAVCGGDFALLSTAITWINALPAGQVPAAGREYAVNIRGGTFVEAANITIPQYVHVGGEGEGTILDMTDAELTIAADASLQSIIVTSTADDTNILMQMSGNNGTLRDVRLIVTGAGNDGIHIGGYTGIELYHVILEATSVAGTAIYCDGSTALLWDVKAEDRTYWGTAGLYLDGGAVVTAKFCEFGAEAGGDDVLTIGGTTWNHFAVQFDPDNVTIAAGTHHALPTKRFNQEVIVAEEGGDFQELSEAVAWINAQGDAAAGKIYGVLMMAGNYSEAAVGDVTIPSWVSVVGQGKDTKLDMGANNVLMPNDDCGLQNLEITNSSACTVCTSGDRVYLRDLFVYSTGPVVGQALATSAGTTFAYNCVFNSSINDAVQVSSTGVLLLDHCTLEADDYGLVTVAGYTGTVTTLWCKFTCVVNDVRMNAGTWEHFCCQLDPTQIVIIAGTQTPLTHGYTRFADKVYAGTFGAPVDVEVTQAGQYGFELHYSGNNVNVTALRARASLITTDAPTRHAIGGRFTGAGSDDVDASLIEGAYFEALGKGTANATTIDKLVGIDINPEYEAFDVINNYKGIYLRCVTDARLHGFGGTSYGIYLYNQQKNEADGGQLDAGIWIGTNLTAPQLAYDYCIDMNNSSGHVATADVRFSSGGTMGGVGTEDVVIDAAGLVILNNGDLEFAAGSGSNVITFPDNVADALHFVDAGDANDYFTFVSTDGSREVVVNQDGIANMDLRVESSASTHTLFVQGSDGYIGVHTVPTELFHVYRNANDTACTVRVENVHAGNAVQARTRFITNSYAAGLALTNTPTVHFGTVPGFFIYGEAAPATVPIGIAQGANIRVYITTAGNFGINTITTPHGGIGYAMFAMDGPNASAAGPHMQWTTASDNYPLMQMLHWAHDNISIQFDAYHDGADRSSDVGSNFAIWKLADVLRFQYDSGIAAGNVLAWNVGIALDTSGNVGLGTAAPGSITEWNMADEDLEFVDAHVAVSVATVEAVVEVLTPTGGTGYIAIYSSYGT